MSSPLSGVSGPRRTEKGEMKFSLLWESMGNFCILAVFERYLSNAWTDPHQIYLCSNNVCRRAPFPCGVHRPLGGGEMEIKTQKMGLVSFVLQTATIFIFLSASTSGSICRAQTCAQSGVEPSRSEKGVSTKWAKKFKKNLNFSPFQDFTSLYLTNYKNRGI